MGHAANPETVSRASPPLPGLTLLLALVPAAAALERAERVLGLAEGLDVDAVDAAAFDRDGFLWVGTPIGLRRFDGARFSVVAPPVQAQPIFAVHPLPDGGLVLQEPNGTLWSQQGLERTRIEPPPGSSRVYGSAVGAEGRLWVLRDGRAYRREGDAWTNPLASQLLRGEASRHLIRRGSHLTVVTNRGALRVEGTQVSRLLEVPPGKGLVDVLDDPAPGVLTLAWDGSLERWEHGRLVDQLRGPGGRGVGLHQRRSTTWVGWAGELGRVEDGALVERRPYPIRSRMLTGPDGSLYIPSVNGLRVLPEPDTVTFALDDGLPSPSVRFVTLGPPGSDVVWVSTWEGSVRIDGEQVQPERSDQVSREPWCMAEDGRALGFAVVDERGDRSVGLAEWTANGAQSRISWPARWTGFCTSSHDGTVWLSADRALLRRRPGHSLERVRTFRSGFDLFDDGGGWLWAVDIGWLCHVPLERADQADAWTCHDGVGGDHRPSGVVAFDDGARWVTTRRNGLWVYRNGSFVRHERSREVTGAADVLGMDRSPRGGVWLAGHGLLARFDQDLQVVERLRFWHGVGRRAAGHVVEAPDGTLWLATGEGVTRVPPHARAEARTAPSVAIEFVEVNGRRTSMGSGRTQGASVEVGAPPSHVSIRLAGLSLRDPERIRYQLAIGSEAPRPMPNREVTLVDLPAGTYDIAITGSFNGSDWSPAARLQLVVAGPWWQQPWAVGLFIGAAVLAVGVAWGVRETVLLARRRERTRIAMDLHDELGSAVGSMRLVAALAVQPSIDDATRARVGGHLLQISDRVYANVRALSWALRTTSTTTHDLSRNLEVRAHELFPTEAVTVEIMRDGPPRRLSLDVCRELQAIAAEALHNVARHADATHVQLSIGVEAGRVCLTVTDDGRGFDADQPDPSGFGLQSMRRRAERIGASFSVSSLPDLGTSIRVSATPHRGVR